MPADDNSQLPTNFDEEFLTWFRERTEATWSMYKARSFEEFKASGVDGVDWQRGTRWLHGLTEEEITVIEQRWQLRFPPDYRLFLALLHSIDRPQQGAIYKDGVMVSTTRPSFYNWQTDSATIQERYDDIVDGLLFDVVHNNLWPPEWGEKPVAEEAQKVHIVSLVAAAPKLIPIFGHRFLLAEPCQSGNPVISIHQSDMIIYGTDLLNYFLVEFGDLVGVDDAASIVRNHYVANPVEFKAFTSIPFWGTFLS